MGFSLGGILKSVAGPVVGGLFGLAGGAMQNSASARAARDANAFTTQQMQYRHQWEVNDLLKAGLNPVLSANGTPSMGGSAVADVVNPADSAFRGVSSAIEAKRLQAEVDNLIADTEKKTTEGQLNDVIAAKTIQDRKLTMINQSVAAHNAAAAAAQAVSAKAQAALDVKKKGIEKEWYSGKGGRLSTALDKLNPLKFFDH